MVYQHKVISNKKLNGKFNIIRFKSKSGGFLFKMGQFTTIRVSDSMFRCYSFASTPEELPFWEIFVDITPGGPGSKYLKTLKSGEKVETLGTRGQLVLKNGLKNYVFGATGCGIAPFLPMFKQLVGDKNNEIYVYWGLRNEGDITLIELLESYLKLNNNFHFEIVLSKPRKGWKGKTGHITGRILTCVKKMPVKDVGVYLSGSNIFITSASRHLVKQGFPSGEIYHEACY